MLNIPQLVKVGGHQIRVVFKEKWSENTEGEWFPELNEIWIRNGLAPSQSRVTLLHELFHVLNSELDHAIVESLSQQLFQVLSDNKLKMFEEENIEDEEYDTDDDDQYGQADEV